MRATVASVSIGVGLVMNDVSCMCDLARLLPTLDVCGDERDKDDISFFYCAKREKMKKQAQENIKSDGKIFAF
jgi:hypothetical protein